MTCRHGSPQDKCRICILEKELADQKAITELRNAEIKRLRKFLMDFRERTPYAMYIEMIDGVLMSNATS